MAIPCSIGYAYLSSRVNALMRDMERAGIEVVNLITDHRRNPNIVEFEPSDRARVQDAPGRG